MRAPERQAAPAIEPYEVRARVTGRTASARDAERIGEEVEALYTNGPSAAAARSKSVREVLAIGTTFVARELVRVRRAVRGDLMKLRQIAHSRSGDKGNVSNISVIAFDEKDYPFLVQHVTSDRVKVALWRDRPEPTSFATSVRPSAR